MAATGIHDMAAEQPPGRGLWGTHELLEIWELQVVLVDLPPIVYVLPLGMVKRGPGGVMLLFWGQRSRFIRDLVLECNG